MTMSEVPAPEHPAIAPTSIGDRFYAWRDSLLASPRFQRWAAAFPLTRSMARTNANDLFDLCAGFVYAQVLAAAVRLRLMPILSEGPQTLEDLARRLSLSPEAARCLLEAAVPLRLVAHRRGGRYGLGMLGAAFLGNPGLADMIEHHRLFYDDMADPVTLLREPDTPTRLKSFWAYARDRDPSALSDSEVAAYTRLMAASQGFVADDILDAFPLARARTLMDLGGGDGTFLMSAARRNPDLQLVLFDLPPVADRARERFAAAGLSQRARTFGGDFRRDALPTGADVISLVRVVHDHDDVDVMAILRVARAALPPGGTLLVAEPMADAPGAERVGAVYFNFYLRAMGSGRARSAQDLRALLAAAGFTAIDAIRTRRPMLTSLITAR